MSELIARNGYVSGTATLAPARLKLQIALFDGIARLELDGLFPSQAKGLLQANAELDARVLGAIQLLFSDGRDAGCVGHVLPARQTIMVVTMGHGILYIHLGRPPAKRGQSILTGSGTQPLLRPDLCDGYHVFQSQRHRLHLNRYSRGGSIDYVRHSAGNR